MVANCEKVDILTTALVMPAKRSKKSKWTAFGLFALLAGLSTATFLHSNLHGPRMSFVMPLNYRVAKLCPQSDVLYPESHVQLWKSLGHDFDQDVFMTRAVAWLSGAVHIP
jgi:hypothetical protein